MSFSAARRPMLQARPRLFLTDIILTAYPTRRWQNVWMSIIVHSAQSVFVIIFILTLVLG